jgi:cadmium resistance protein CadD (predicted permease)
MKFKTSVVVIANAGANNIKIALPYLIVVGLLVHLLVIAFVIVEV